MGEELLESKVRERFVKTFEQVDYMVECLRSQKMLKMELSEVEEWLAEQGKELKRRILENHYDSRRQKEAENERAKAYTEQ